MPSHFLVSSFSSLPTNHHRPRQQLRPLIQEGPRQHLPLVELRPVAGSLADVSFVNSDFRDASFATESLDGARFVDADLRDARFHSDGRSGESLLLTNADFSGADLRGASFADCFFVGASFAGAKLMEIRLEGTRFKNCDFSAAQLGESPDWTGAILNEVILSVDQASAIRLPGGMGESPREKGRSG